MGATLETLLLLGLDMRENFQEDILAEQRRLTRGSHHGIHRCHHHHHGHVEQQSITERRRTNDLGTLFFFKTHFYLIERLHQ